MSSAERPPFNPNRVEWSGDNFGMYLRLEAGGPHVALISLFRVALSPRGRGHAAFLLLDPGGDGTGPDRPNVCLTDNEALAGYLCREFLSAFAGFKGSRGIESMAMRPGRNFRSLGDGCATHTESLDGEIGQVVLTWEGLSKPFMAEIARHQSLTGRHELFATCVDADAVRVSIGGRSVEGKPFPRDWLGRTSSSAFLAFSETWIKI